MRYKKINPELFTYNRQRFVGQMKPNSIAIFHANDIMPTNADGTHHFEQNSDLFYLTGVDQEDTALILYPDAPLESQKEILLVRRTNDLIKVWEGEKLTLAGAKHVSGCKNVVWFDELDTMLGVLVNRADTIYINLNEHDRSNNPVQDRNSRYTTQLKGRFPLHKFERAAPVMQSLRTIKSDLEIDLLQNACNITDKAFRRILKFVKPGVNEYEIEAEIIHEFIRSGASGHAYHPIIASGKDSCILHYDKNDKVCKDGDILLMDFGSAYANYSSDLSRTIPVNGRYTERQANVYNAALRVMKAATAMLVPGTEPDHYNKEIAELMTAELVGLGLIDKHEVTKQDPKRPLYKEYFMHGTSHFLGLDTHDVGDRYATFKAGMVFTCEPGIYIPKENLGVRIENDILITADKPDDLMKNIPREVEEIEEIMNS